jgi:hypothetical protein
MPRFSSSIASWQLHDVQEPQSPMATIATSHSRASSSSSASAAGTAGDRLPAVDESRTVEALAQPPLDCLQELADVRPGVAEKTHALARERVRPRRELADHGPRFGHRFQDDDFCHKALLA